MIYQNQYFDLLRTVVIYIYIYVYLCISKPVLSLGNVVMRV
jgi:hypothetical protein